MPASKSGRKKRDLLAGSYRMNRGRISGYVNRSVRNGEKKLKKI